MRYLIALLLPPVAVLMCGKPGKAILNLLLTCCFWLPGAIHAVMLVADHKADKRMDRLIEATRRPA